MADKKITELTNITGVNLVDADEFVVVDISADETKAITLGELKNAFDTGSGFVRITGDTMTGDLSFGDNDKAIFGAGSDLQIFHLSANNASYIQEQNASASLNIDGTDVYIRSYPEGDNMIIAERDGAVTLHYDDSPKLATQSGGVNITGTLTSDSLTVDGDVTINSTFPRIFFYESDTTNLNSTLKVQGGSLLFQSLNDDGTGTTSHMAINNSTGDISFYASDGTTPAFHWDAADESLGIGTSSPSAALDVSTGGSTKAAIFDGNGVEITHPTLPSNLFLGTQTGSDVKIASVGAYPMLFHTNGSEAMRLSAAGDLELIQSNNLYWKHAGGGTIRAGITADSSDNLVFSTGSSDSTAMTIDGSGNLLVGKTGAGTNTAGAQVDSNGRGNFTVDANFGLLVNRKTSDGELARFQKDGTTVGSIGTLASNININSLSTGRLSSVGVQRLLWDADQLYPATDNVYNLGFPSFRFDDIYATNATIQTSDRNEKQDIAELNTAETAVAVACKGLLRKFRWKDSVAEKGDEARTHFGIIAQDLQAAFEAEGLDAGDYAMFMSDTWTDEETNEEKTRMGVRYSELLAFIIAAL